MVQLGDFIFSVGWDSDTLEPVVVSKERSDNYGLWGGPAFKMRHNLLWFEKRYGPMHRMSVHNTDECGNPIVLDSGRKG